MVNCEYIKQSKRYSEEKISKISKDLNRKLSNKNISIITTGSFARGEASEHSDLDIMVIAKNTPSELLFVEKEEISKVIKNYIIKDVGDTGTFGIDAIETLENLLTNLGGDKDDNVKFTRRMLFLLESKVLYNEALYSDAKKRLIERYVDEFVEDDQIVRFLLNDFIRYYRTITTDFEYKVNEAGKSWGLRNIKLTFSRKILYFAGIIAVAQTYDKPRDEKIQILNDLLELSPIERIQKVCEGNEANALALYDDFLSKMSNKSVREELEHVQKESRKECCKFVDLKSKSKDFSTELQKILKSQYREDHPIHNALLF